MHGQDFSFYNVNVAEILHWLSMCCHRDLNCWRSLSTNHLTETIFPEKQAACYVFNTL